MYVNILTILLLGTVSKPAYILKIALYCTQDVQGIRRRMHRSRHIL